MLSKRLPAVVLVRPTYAYRVAKDKNRMASDASFSRCRQGRVVEIRQAVAAAGCLCVDVFEADYRYGESQRIDAGTLNRIIGRTIRRRGASQNLPGACTHLYKYENLPCCRIYAAGEIGMVCGAEPRCYMRRITSCRPCPGWALRAQDSPPSSRPERTP